MKTYILLFFVVLLHASSNYQERNLYYDEKDNVCFLGERSDVINLTIILNENKTIELQAIGLVLCEEWVSSYWWAIHPGVVLSADYGDDEIFFYEDITRVNVLGIIRKILKKTTINRIIINNIKYECQIVGSETVQHFGNVNIMVTCFDPSEEKERLHRNKEIYRKIYLGSPVAERLVCFI